MALRPAYALVHSDYNAFLFASLGEEASGLDLTMLSAMARLDLDPWGEAARLSSMPVEAATSALAALLDALPEGGWKTSDSRSIAARLLASLPRRGPQPSAPTKDGDAPARLARKTGDRLGARRGAPRWLIWIAVGAALAFALSRISNDTSPYSLDLSDALEFMPGQSPGGMAALERASIDREGRTSRQSPVGAMLDGDPAA